MSSGHCVGLDSILNMQWLKLNFLPELMEVFSFALYLNIKRWIDRTVGWLVNFTRGHPSTTLILFRGLVLIASTKEIPQMKNGLRTVCKSRSLNNSPLNVRFDQFQVQHEQKFEDYRTSYHYLYTYQYAEIDHAK